MKLLLALLLVAPLYVRGQSLNDTEGTDTDCFNNCNNNCDNGCSTNCVDTGNTNCDNGCSTNCVDTCNTKCVDTCNTNCVQNCNTNCVQNSNTNCGNNCQAQCSTSCKPKSNDCTSKCNSVCENNCKSNCKTSTICNSDCETNCKSNFKTNTNCKTNCNDNSCVENCSKSNCKTSSCSDESNCKPCVNDRDLTQTFCGTTSSSPEKITEECKSCNDTNVVVHVNNTCAGNVTPQIILPPPILPNITFGGVKVDIRTPSIIVHNNPNITITHACGNVHVSSTGNSSFTFKSSNCSDVNTETSKESLVVKDVVKENCCQIHDGDDCIRQPGMRFVICYPKYRKHCGAECNKSTRPTVQPTLPPCVPSWPYGMCRSPCYGPCHGANFQPRQCYGSYCGMYNSGGCNGIYC